MTNERDFDRLARAWLELSANEAPDRVIDAVLQAVEATPQVRRPLRRALWRLPTMNRSSIAAAVAAATVVAVGGALWLTRPGPSIGGPSTLPNISIPVAATVAPSAAAELPVALRERWLGGGLQSAAASAEGRTILFSATTLGMSNATQQQAGFFASTAGIAPDGRLRIESPRSRDGCQVGDVGSYPWSLSQSGQTLTISTGSDACGARADAVPGSWWSDDCKNGDCLGLMDAGTYGSQYIDPRLDPAAVSSWVPRFGALTFTVPDGWANSADWPSSFSLTPAADYGRETSGGPPDGVDHDIYVFVQPAAERQDAACSGAELTSVGRDVDSLVSWLSKLPAVRVSNVGSITVGGHQGTMLDVSLAPSWTHACAGDPQPAVELFRPAGTRAAHDSFGVGVNRSGLVRLVLLDIGGGDVIGIAIEDRNDATGSDTGRFDALVQAAMPIVRTFSFK